MPSSDMALRRWQFPLPRDTIQNVWKMQTVSYPVPTGQKECFYTLLSLFDVLYKQLFFFINANTKIL